MFIQSRFLTRYVLRESLYIIYVCTPINLNPIMFTQVVPISLQFTIYISICIPIETHGVLTVWC